MSGRPRPTALMRIARRNLARRPLRTALTIFGIALGVSLILAVEIGRVSTIDSFLAMIDDLSGKASLQVNAESNGGFPASTLAKIRGVDGVEFAAPSISRVISVQKSARDEPEALQLLAVDTRTDRRIRRYELKAGVWPRGRHDVLLTEGYARRSSLRAGGRFSLLTPEGPVRVKVSGLLAETGVGRAAQGNLVVTGLGLARDIYLLEGQITAVDVALEPGVSVGAVQKKVARALDPRLNVERPESRGTSITRTINFIMSSLNSLSVLVLMAGAFIIFGTLRMNVEEQERQIGTVRALGASRPQVFLMAVGQGLILGTIGSALGLLLGYGLAGFFIDAVQQALQLAPAKLSPAGTPAVQAFLGGIGTAVLATLAPAMRASRLAPVEAMAGRSRTGSRRLEHLGLIVPLLILTAASLVWVKPKTLAAYNVQIIILVLGVVVMSSWLVKVVGALLTTIAARLPGQSPLIAARNLVRGRAQTGTALATIVLSLVITLVAGELAASDRQFFKRIVSAALPYDINIGNPPYSTFSANRRPPMDKRMAKRIEAIEGVRRIDPVRFLAVRGLDMDLFGIFVDTGLAPPKKLAINELPTRRAMKMLDRGDRVILGSAVTKKTGVKVGDRIKLKTPAGNRPFKVIATIHHPASNGEVALISRHDLKKYWGDTAVDYFQILVDKDADVETVKRRLIDRIGQPYGVTVVSSREEHTTIMGAVDQFLGTLDSMGLIAAIISGLAIMNAQVMNVLHRQREIAVMRAIGSSRRLIRRLVVMEAVFLGLIGLAVGLAVGLPLSHSIIALGEEIAGFALTYVRPDGPLKAALFIALGVTFLASLYPAERAARARIILGLRRD